MNFTIHASLLKFPCKTFLFSHYNLQNPEKEQHLETGVGIKIV